MVSSPGRGRRHGLAWTTVGLALGGVGTTILLRLLEATLPRIVQAEASVLGGLTGGMLVVALLACLIPARRATAVDPASALRSE